MRFTQNSETKGRCPSAFGLTPGISAKKKKGLLSLFCYLRPAAQAEEPMTVQREDALFR